MRFGIFVACAGTNAGGPETYERRLVEHVARLRGDNELHVFCLSQTAADVFDVADTNVRFHVLRPASRWISVPISLPFELLRQRLALYHATLVPAPLSPVRLVFTMHDTTPFERPEFYPAGIGRRLRHLIRRGIGQAQKILCISEHARATTAKHFGLDPDRMAVVHHGVDPRFRPMPIEEAEAGLPSTLHLRHGFVLYVGKLESRKNILRLLEAYHRFRMESDDAPPLVLAGRRSWDFPAMDEAIERLDLADHVVELGYVADSLLPALFAAAGIFVFPSLWEGFGIPVLEAMASGTAVITSTTSCLPEIAGGAAKLVDPESVEEIAAALYELQTTPELRADLRARGLARAAEFTWERTARETLAVYERVANG